MFEELIQRAGKQNLLTGLTGSSNHTHILEIRKGGAPDGSKLNEGIQLYIPIDSAPDTKEKLEAIVTKLKEEGPDYYKKIDVEIEQKKGVGEVFGDYGEIKKVFGEGTSNLASVAGQVLLVDVWATWCGPCQGPMTHNQEMLTKFSDKWKNKVRIVGVSVDQDINDVKQRVEKKGWTSIEHLTLEKWDGEHRLIKDFGISGIPFVCLIDTVGRINYIGHPMSIDLEVRINELLEAEPTMEPKEGQIQGALSKQEASFIIEKLSTEDFMKKYFQKAEFVSVKIEAKINFKNNTAVPEAKIKIYGTARDTELLDAYEKQIPKGVKFEKKIIDEIQIPKPEKACSGCSEQLTYPLYWCKWDNEGKFFRCRKCVENLDPSNYYTYLQNSILLMEDTPVIPSSNLGKNLQPKNISAELQPKMYACNGCGQCPGEIGLGRYVCLCCRSEPNYYGDFVDVCENCIKKYIQNDKEKVEAINVDGHTRAHAFVRILFDVDGYYKY